MVSGLVSPVTFGQLSVWRSIQDLPPERRASANLLRTWKIPAGTTVVLLEHAIQHLITRHESLRTVYRFTGVRGIEQVVSSDASLPVAACELGSRIHELVDSVAADLAARAFNIKREKPLRATVVTNQGHPEYLVLCVHHMAADGAALEILHDELVTLLAGKDLAGPAPNCRALASEQMSTAWTSRRLAAERYWRRVFENAALTSDIGDATGTVLWAELRSTVVSKSVPELSRKLRVSIQSVIFAAYCKALCERTGGHQILVGLIAGNRVDPRYKGLVSSLDQLVPVLVDLRQNEQFDSFVLRVHRLAFTAYRHACFDVDSLQAVEREFGVNGSGAGFRYFFNFMPPTTGAVIEGGDPISAAGWEVKVETQGRDNGFASYFRAGISDGVWCSLREASDDQEGMAQRKLLNRFHDLLRPAV